MTVDEDDDDFFHIRYVQQMCQEFNSQDFELIIFGIVSAVCIAIAYDVVFQLLSEPDKLNRF